MRAAGRIQLLVVLVALGLVAGGAVAWAQTEIPPSVDPPTEPSTTTTTTTTTPTAPPSTTSTAPPRQDDDPAKAPDGPSDSVRVPTAAETAAAHAAFAALTDDQRDLLRRLQTSRDDLATARHDVVTVGALVDTAQARLASAEAELQRANADVSAATHTFERLHGELTDLAEAMYSNLGSAVLLDTVNTADHTEVNRVRTYAKAPEQMLDTLVERASATKRRLTAARARAADARSSAATAVRDAQAALQKQRAAVAAAEDASTAAVAAVTESLGSNAALLTQVADPHFGADAITAALAVTQADEPDPVTVFGAFRNPVPGAPLGSPYGIRVDPMTGSIGYHPGIDFEAAAGAPVHAAASGTVVMAGDCGGYGNCVVIDHGYSLATVSAHLSRVLVTVGAPVTDGQVVGLVGSTGRSTGPHLHFEVRLHGIPIDPILTLRS